MKFLTISIAVLLFINNTLAEFSTLAENATNEEIDGKVLGGVQVSSIEQYPYMASLRLASGNHFCGGSIISDLWILTAAHCLQAASPSYVMVGTTRLNSGGYAYPVTESVIHPGYNPSTNVNDIGMVRLDRKIQFGTTVKPITIRADYVSETRAVLTGWGYTTYPGGVSNNLQSINLMTISDWSCNQQWQNQVGTSQICTYTRVGEGSCHADSGGPLVAGGQQIGVVSFGHPCAAGMPDVYTRTSAFRQWILQTASK